MKSTLLAVIVSLIWSMSVSAQFHSDRIETAAKEAQKLYQDADIAGGIQAQRDNLDTIHEIEMDSIVRGAELQASLAIRSVTDLSDDIIFFRQSDKILSINNNVCPGDVFAPPTSGEIDRTTHPFDFLIRCRLKITADNVGSLKQLIDIKGDLISENLRVDSDRSSLGRRKAEVEGSVDRSILALGKSDGVIKKRNVSIESDPDIGDRTIRDLISLRNNLNAEAEKLVEQAVKLEQEARVLEVKRRMSDKAKTLKVEAQTLRAIDVFKGVKVLNAMGSDAPNCSASYFVLANRESIESKIDHFLVCWRLKTEAVKALRATIKAEKQKYKRLNHCLVSIDKGLLREVEINQIINTLEGHDETNSSMESRSEMPTPARAEKARDYQVNIKRAVEVCSEHAIKNAKNTLEKYVARLKTIDPGTGLLPSAEALAEDQQMKKQSYDALIKKLFPIYEINNERCTTFFGKCLAKDGEKKQIIINPLVEKGEIGARISAQISSLSVKDLPLIEAMVKRIEKASLIAIEDLPAPVTPEKIKSKLKELALKIDDALDLLASNATNIGVEIAAVEAQLDAISFIVDAASEEAVPEFDPDEACGDLNAGNEEQQKAAAACRARLEELSPRVKAAAAIAGSVPGFLTSMQNLIESQASPPPRGLVIAKKQLDVRSQSLQKRLLILEAEAGVWRSLAQDQTRLLQRIYDVLQNLDVFCSKIKGTEYAGHGGLKHNCIIDGYSTHYKPAKGATVQAMTPDHRRLLLRVISGYADVAWFGSYAEDTAFNKLIHLGHLNVALIDEETIMLSDAIIEATLQDITFRSERGLKPETVGDFAGRLINLGLLGVIAFGVN